MLLLSVLSWKVSQAWNPRQSEMSPGTENTAASQLLTHSDSGQKVSARETRTLARWEARVLRPVDSMCRDEDAEGREGYVLRLQPDPVSSGSSFFTSGHSVAGADVDFVLRAFHYALSTLRTLEWGWGREGRADRTVCRPESGFKWFSPPVTQPHPTPCSTANAVMFLIVGLIKRHTLI